MLLVDDEESESSESHIFREESMSPHDDVDRTESHFFEYFFYIPCMRHTSECAYPHAERSESLLEGLSVLLCEDEEWRDDSDL